MTATLEKPAAADVPQARRRYGEYAALAVLLVVTAVGYLWDLGSSGWANSFYSAAVQAGSQSWEAFFFGSSDAANSITVDKPPASLWLMVLSVRMFGLSSWSILVPQALLGVASVALLWASVRRYFGAAAGLLAGALLALTPVAALMFRFNNPDALLVLLMIAATWTLLRAVEDGRTRWLIATGVFVGLGFLTKQLQVMLVLPPLALTYLLAGPPRLGKRLLQLCAAGGAMVVAAGWWLLAVELWPARSRPWIGGSHENSILELTLGYNGLGRLNGNERGSVGGPADMPGDMSRMWGQAGFGRMFDAAQGGQIAWLLPAAVLLAVAGIALRGKVSRMDPGRAALGLWLGWLLVTAAVFSWMQGIFHAYYTVALAPAIAACVAAGFTLAWGQRGRLWVRGSLVVAIALTAVTSWVILRRTPDFVPWVRWVMLAAAVVAGAALVVDGMGRLAPARRWLAGGILGVTAVAALSGPLAYTIDTVRTSHTGGIVAAGPRSANMFGRMPFGMGERRLPAGMPGAGPGTPNGTPPIMENGPGGLLNATKPSVRVIGMLHQDSGRYTWAAAAVGANSAAGFQLAAQLPVMPVGGFNGTDPAPTLEQFQRYVAEGKIHYFIGGMSRGGEQFGRAGRSTGPSAEITAWVQGRFRAVQVDGVTLYDLTAPDR